MALSKIKIFMGLSLFILTSCSPLVSNLEEYKTINSNTKYLILSQNNKGLKLSLYFEADDFYTDEIRLISEAKLEFKKVARILCEERGEKLGSINVNTYITNADTGDKAAHLVNWVSFAE